MTKKRTKRPNTRTKATTSAPTREKARPIMPKALLEAARAPVAVRQIVRMRNAHKASAPATLVATAHPPALRARAPAFRRHQVERALFICLASGPDLAPTRDFLVRVKHLLELDRSIGTESGYAFSEAPPGGKGEHSLFSAYDALLLYLGVQLLDAGVKRTDVVPLVRELRALLRREIDPIVERGAAERARGDELLADFHLVLEEDARVFLALPRPSGFADYIAPTTRERRRARPRVLVGLNNLRAELGSEDLSLDHLVILEVGAPAYLIVTLLLELPEQKRGRKATRTPLITNK